MDRCIPHNLISRCRRFETGLSHSRYAAIGYSHLGPLPKLLALTNSEKAEEIYKILSKIALSFLALSAPSALSAFCCALVVTGAPLANTPNSITQ